MASAAPDPVTLTRAQIEEAEKHERFLKRDVPAVAVSGGIHAMIAVAFLCNVIFCAPIIHDTPLDNAIIDVKDEKPVEKQDFTNEDVGLDPSKQLNYNVDRIENVSVPGVVRPEEPVGINDAPPGQLQNVAPPPGVGTGAGGGVDSAGPATGSMFGDAGGFLGGKIVPGQMFGGRSGATREKMVTEGGGNSASEAAVAKGLKWLQRQQKADGRWTMVEGTIQDDFGATGLALLPYLAAGITHRVNPQDKTNLEYVKNVDLGLKWLVNKQAGNGLMGTHPTHKHYSHAICTIVLCEAYGLTNDQNLKKAAQKGIDYLIKAQHSAGGFRYQVAQAGDVSVTGWCLQALQSGKLAGLNVPAEAFYKVSNYLDSSQTQNGAAYGYVGPGNSPNMTAVGLLCRAYLGWGPKNPNMIAGVDNLKKNQPVPNPPNPRDMYYYYYATQVMHFCATSDDWLKLWNPKMRDMLVNTQDNTTGPNRGSWAFDNSHTGSSGGRLCYTCLSLLTLEVYYRHLPLYKRDNSGLKDLE